MRQEAESSRALHWERCAWIGALAFIAAMAWAPPVAWAEDTSVEDTAIDDADEADVGPAEAAATEAEAAAAAAMVEGEEVSQETLDHAQAAIEEAERQLEEARRQMALMGRKMAPEPTPAPGTGVGLVSADGRAKKLQWSLNDDGTLYFRMATWIQTWFRAMQMSPGTVANGSTNDWYEDVMIRRARLLMFGQIFPRVFLLFHVGINNQTFRNARKPQVFVHDAWVEFQVSRNKALYLGGGLIYWNGISRQTNASTITLMSLDAPIMNWPLIELEDQFARQLGFYAKGKFGLFDYRVAVTRPFTAFDVSLTANTSAPPPGPVGSYRNTNTWAYTGYFMFQFLDEESNVLPYTVGTYLGAKKVFNFGLGGYAHPHGAQYGESETDPVTGEVTVLSQKSVCVCIGSADLFLDHPFGGNDGGSVTWYGVYQYQSFGPNNLRIIGIENPADPGTGDSLNNGNSYPMIGTGHSLYSELGVLLPGHLAADLKFQPYVNWQGSSFEALDDWMHHVGVGLNMFVHRHNAKVTIEYRNRPLFYSSGSTNAGTVESRKGNSFIMQWHMFI